MPELPPEAPNPSGLPPDLPPDLPSPLVRRWRPSLVWLIPLVAALIGAWIAFASYSQRGPTITISFLSAEGLEAGQTRVRHKEVEVGRVTAIRLSPDFGQVLVTVELDRDAAGMLSEHSRFWVVRARVGANGISGLGTLLSGAFIAMDPGAPGRPSRVFKGLEAAPLLTEHLPGQLIDLQAAQLGSLNIGSPVTFRQIPVGEVAGFDLAPDGQSVRIRILVRDPYRGLVQPTSRFWDAGGVDLGLDANGLRVRSTSLVQVLLGGVAFENPVHPDPAQAPPPGQPFTLFANRDQAYERVYREHLQCVLYFDESVRGLTRGAPVEFRGIRIGEVEDFNLEFETRALKGRIPVLITLEPERFTLLGPTHDPSAVVLARLVHMGLRAELRMGSLLTGNLFVDLGFHPEAKPGKLGLSGDRLVIPTVPSAMSTMLDNLSKLAEKLQKLPLEETVAELRATLPALRQTLEQTAALAKHLDTETAPQATAALAQATATLATLERALRSDAPTQTELRQALDQFTQAARAVRDLADTLERHPEALLFGKGKNP
jgi:paraquat-inducible protein B